MITEATRLRRTRPLALAPAVAVGLLCLGLAGLTDALIRHETHPTGDEPYYQAMAAHPTAPHNFPYAYRIGVPWLVHVLPFSHTTSFTLLSLLAIGAAGGALFALLEEFDVEPWIAAALSVGFALSPTLLVVLPRHGISIDPASILVLVLGTLFIVRRQLLALGMTILIGVTVRESSLFLIPLAYAVWADRLFDRRALRDTLLVGILPVVAYVILRTSIDALGRQYEPGYNGPFLKARVDIVRNALSGSSAPIELRRLAYAFGVLWLVSPFALKDLPFARRGLVLFALCVASLTFAYDWGRVIFLAAPVVYVAAAHVLRGRSRLAVAVVLAVLALDLGYGIYLQVHGVQHGLDTSVSRHIPVY